MHAVDALEHAVELATQLGYTVREECLGGSGGGSCELKGRKLLFLDLDLGPADQLELVLDVLRHEPDSAKLPMPQALRELVTLRKSV